MSDNGDARPDFLRALDVELDADERTLRRAYAKRLKAIDIEADPRGFQALRETLEAALRWHAQRSLPADDAAARPVRATFDFDDDAASRLSALVAERFARFGQLIATFDEVATADRALAAALADPALASLSGKEEFEALVAMRLADGWQPGHGELLSAACTRFKWLIHRGRLAVLGSAGSLLDAALEEFAAMQLLPSRQRIQLLRVAQRLCETHRPPLGEALVSGPDIRWLLRHHPHWLAIVAPLGSAEHWLDALNWPEVTQRKVAPSSDDRPRPPAWLRGNGPQRVLQAVAIVTLLASLWKMFASRD